MEELARYEITLADGTIFSAVGDGTGNMIISEKLDKSIFSDKNLKKVHIVENGCDCDVSNYTLRTFYHQNDSSTFIRLSEKTAFELLRDENAELREQNQILIDCILEMSEIIYGGEL